MREHVSLKFPDGDCRTLVCTPGGAGQWPAAILYMDGLGIRESLYAKAEKLAQAGYVVLLPDIYFRVGPYPPMDPKAVAATGDVMKALAPYLATTNNAVAGADTAAFLAYLDTRGDVKGKKIGTTGYCMGGGMSLTAAGMYPDRVAAAAAFHGGQLASDSPMSPHLLAAKMKAEIYVGGADQDKGYPPEMAVRLEQTLAAAGVKHRCEIYVGALHGYTTTDGAVYDKAADDRHWREMIALFDRALK